MKRLMNDFGKGFWLVVGLWAVARWIVRWAVERYSIKVSDFGVLYVLNLV